MKTGYNCQIVADSINPLGNRLTTFVITYPRVVLAEAVTHRVNQDSWPDDVVVCERAMPEHVDKSSASSRAISIKRMMEMVRENPYIPEWTKDQNGMQGGPLTGESLFGGTLADAASTFWLQARDHSVTACDLLTRCGVHKQDANRLLEPFAWVTQVVTSSYWPNFFALRCDEGAHPAIRKIARYMYLHFRQSEPAKFEYGQWHLPFGPKRWSDPRFGIDWLAVNWDESSPLPLVESVARCAWASYARHDGDGSEAAMRATVGKLAASRPVHASPFGHQACAVPWITTRAIRSNLAPGWLQLRKLVPHEKADTYDPTPEEVGGWPETAEIGS